MWDLRTNMSSAVRLQLLIFFLYCVFDKTSSLLYNWALYSRVSQLEQTRLHSPLAQERIVRCVRKDFFLQISTAYIGFTTRRLQHLAILLWTYSFYPRDSRHLDRKTKKIVPCRARSIQTLVPSAENLMRFIHKHAGPSYVQLLRSCLLITTRKPLSYQRSRTWNMKDKLIDSNSFLSSKKTFAHALSYSIYSQTSLNALGILYYKEQWCKESRKYKPWLSIQSSKPLGKIWLVRALLFGEPFDGDDLRQKDEQHTSKSYQSSILLSGIQKIFSKKFTRAPKIDARAHRVHE